MALGRTCLHRDAARLAPKHARGIDVELLLHDQRLGAHQAGELRREDDADRDHAVGRGRRPARRSRAIASTIAGNDSSVSITRLIDVVDPAAEETREQADRHADQDARPSTARKLRIERGRRAVDQPAEHVAAEVVGAEQMRGVGLLQRVVDVLRRSANTARSTGASDRPARADQQRGTRRSAADSAQLATAAACRQVGRECPLMSGRSADRTRCRARRSAGSG